MQARERLLLVGYEGGTHVAASLRRAAQQLVVSPATTTTFAEQDPSRREKGLRASEESATTTLAWVGLANAAAAFAGPPWQRRLAWHLGGRRPPRLTLFSRHVLELCREQQVTTLLATGLAPLRAVELRELGRLGVRRRNFLTDDPWNRVLAGHWIRQALPHYEAVFSPRQANLADLQALGVANVFYLPFAYDPVLFYPAAAREIEAAGACDILFVGGADRDRLPLMQALLRAGIDLHIYGGGWGRFPQVACFKGKNARGPAWRGEADPPRLRGATAAAKIALCLVRRANRDGHVMRSYEIPAVGACLLAEDTADHRALYGDTAAYFANETELVEQTRALLAEPAHRQALAAAATARVRNAANTYAARLLQMLRR